ncbi:MAG: RnfABCDGE type electron transport complex subunit D [Pseudomonadota bacterium]
MAAAMTPLPRAPVRRRRFSSRMLMWLTVACLTPGALTQAYWFGPGVLLNLVLGVAAALVLEALFDRRPWREALKQPDGAAAIAGALIALALPPTVPAGVLLFAVLCALGLGKHAYGGLGNNPFNPAMVGYAIVLVSFTPSLAEWPDPGAIDALSGATPLDALAHRGGQTIAEFSSGTATGHLGAYGWEWINGGFLLGGLLLLALGICHWRVPAAVLLGLSLSAMAGYDNGSSSSFGAPAFHVFAGASCLTAFFIATDPVSQPSHPRAQWLFGLLIGALIFAIRSFGAYPDGAAFAILLANGCGPWLQASCVRWDRQRQNKASSA